MGFFQNRFDLKEEKKVTQDQIEEYGGVTKLQCFFLQETDECLGPYEQECYHDEAPMCGPPNSSASYHALILRGTEESLYRLFGSLFGLGVGIRNE